MNLTIEQFLIKKNANIADALLVIDKNAHGICFVVDEDEKLFGIITDGDIRRSFLKGEGLETKISTIINSSFISLSVDLSAEQVNQALNEKIKCIPLVDDNNKVVDYASHSRARQIPIMQPSLAGNELNYVTECVRTGWISSQGSFVKKFESMFADYCQVPYALAVSNGTTALHLALACLHIGPGDEVIVPDYTFAASINAVIYTGATPVLVDVDRESWTMDIESLKLAITENTRAIMPVHIYGQPCNMNEIMAIAKQKNILIVEDCAEALGSFYNGKHVGSFGEVGTFSFFGNKTITTGEGGMLTFKNKEIYELAAVMRDHGMSKQKRYWHDMVGFNYRMTNLQAAIGVAQMERIDGILKSKRHLAEVYSSTLKDITGIQLHGEQEGTKNSFWLYTILINSQFGISRNELIDRLKKNGIEARPAFFPLHQMPVYSSYTRNGKFNNSLYISDNGLSLPSFTDITYEEQQAVLDAIEKVYAIKLFQKN